MDTQSQEPEFVLSLQNEIEAITHFCFRGCIPQGALRASHVGLTKLASAGSSIERGTSRFRQSMKCERKCSPMINEYAFRLMKSIDGQLQRIADQLAKQKKHEGAVSIILEILPVTSQSGLSHSPECLLVGREYSIGWGPFPGCV